MPRRLRPRAVASSVSGEMNPIVNGYRAQVRAMGCEIARRCRDARPRIESPDSMSPQVSNNQRSSSSATSVRLSIFAWTAQPASNAQ